MAERKHSNTANPTDVQFVPHLVGDRFFTVPKFGDTVDEVEMDARLVQHEVQLVGHLFCASPFAMNQAELKSGK
jgi:hypothetical protein